MNEASETIRLGLRENLGQFTLLAVDNVFVGMLVGSERSVVPLLGAQTFHVASLALLLAFVVSFGLVKGPLNLLAGRLADRWGRRRVLLTGWLIGLPAPWLLMFAPGWWVVVAANLLLGANQGLAWTMTVTSKIDLVGPRRRGLALGVNEFSGYLGVALGAAATGDLAARFGLRPAPFLLAAAVTVVGLLIPLLGVRETLGFTRLEAVTVRTAGEERQGLASVFRRVSWEDRTLFACSQAGMLNKFCDTAVWGLLPVAMAGQQFGVATIGAVAGTYAFVWGTAQLWTGLLSDQVGRKIPIAGGLALNAVGLGLAAVAHRQSAWFAAAIVMGLGTALLYPVLLAAVSDLAHPAWRGTALGVYRLWRDGGYAVGGLLVGFAAARLSPAAAFLLLSAVILASAGVVTVRMCETHARAKEG
jgi:MFS family permease